MAKAGDLHAARRRNWADGFRTNVRTGHGLLRRISCARLHESLVPTPIREGQMAGSILGRSILCTATSAKCASSPDTSPRGSLSEGADPVPY